MPELITQQPQAAVEGKAVNVETSGIPPAPKVRFPDTLQPETRQQVDKARGELGKILSLSGRTIPELGDNPQDIDAITNARIKTLADLASVKGLSPKLQTQITSLMEQELRAAGRIKPDVQNVPADLIHKAYQRWTTEDMAQLNADTRLQELTAAGKIVPETASALNIAQLYETFQAEKSQVAAVTEKMQAALTKTEPVQVMQQLVKGELDPKQTEKTVEPDLFSHKRRDQLQRNFDRLLREIFEKDTSGKLPVGNLANLLLSPTLQPTDRKALVDTMTARLQFAGMLPQNPRDPTELGNAYLKLSALEQQQLERVDLEKFYKEHPDVRIDPSLGPTNGSNREMVSYKYFNATYQKEEMREFYLETKVVERDNISLLLADDKKGEDAIGLSKNPDGSINIAVADGMSDRVAAKVSSRLAIKTALDDLSTRIPSSQTLERVWNELQITDFPLMARKVIKDWEAKGADVALLKELMAKGKFAGTTLGAAKYEKGTNRLQIALKSDVTTRIFHADGTSTAYQNPDMSEQLKYEPYPNTKYSHAAETVRNIALQHGDLILLHSDGLKDEAIQEFNKHLADLRKSGKRLDTAAMSQTADILKTQGVNDDISAVFVYHE